MKSDDITAFFYTEMMFFLVLLLDDNRPKQHTETEIINYFVQFIKYLTYIVNHTIEPIYTNISLIVSNIFGIGTNAGRLTDHLDCKFYRNRIRGVC